MKIVFLVALFFVFVCAKRIPLVDYVADAPTCLPPYFNWEYCPNDPGRKNYTMFPSSITLEPDNAATIVPGTQVTFLIQGSTVLTSVPDGDYLIMVWGVVNGTMYQVSGTLEAAVTISNGKFVMKASFTVPELLNSTSLFFTVDLYVNPTKKEAMCVQVTESIGPSLCPLTCSPQWVYCVNDPGRKNYTLFVGNVTVSPNAHNIAPGSTVNLLVTGTTNITEVPDGNYLLMIWQVANGTKIQLGGTLASILSVGDGTFTITLSFTLPELISDTEMYFTLDLYVNPTKREAVCIEVTEQIGPQCKGPLPFASISIH